MVFRDKLAHYFGSAQQNRYRARGLAKEERMRKARRLLVEPLEERRLLTTIDLASLGSAGFTIFGADASDRSGISVSSAGDVNGDGFDDFVIGASWGGSSGNPNNRFGESYVIFGAASMPATIDLASLGSAGITIFGADADDQSGLSVSSAGDVNGDGFDDVIIAAVRGDASGNVKEDAGESYVIFGAASLPATINLATLGSAGITIFGIDAGDLSGDSVSSAGDVNGDGFDDLIIGASLGDASGNAKNRAGESYVIFGAASLPATIDLANLGSSGITIFGADESDYSGQSVSSAGDINGDGFDDLIIGAYLGDASGNAKVDAGDSYVIFGAASLPATIDLSTLGSAGVTIFGADAEDNSGFSVSSAGDVNGDGFDDLIIGAPDADASGNAKQNAGDSYVIFGAASMPTTINLATLGSAGVTIFGADAEDVSGFSVSSAGDVNGDGFDDLIIGASDADASGNAKQNAGDSYVIFGAASLPTTINLASLGSAGVTIFGADAEDNSGFSVSSAGDVNGDGFDDLIIGAPDADSSGNARFIAGEGYLIFGGNSFTNSISAANLGDSSANTINGTSGAQILNGADGNDTLVGNGGADILIGGRGDDILAVSDLTFKRVVGGNGTDTLRLDGSGLHLNLTTIPDNRIVDIEIIDIRGSGDNTLTLNYREVLNISSHSNTLVVRRNVGDVVNSGSGWTQLADEVIDNTTFQVLSQGNAKLKLQQVPITVIDLAALGSDGTTVYGADAFDRSGFSVNSAGDINGDGFDDFIIGAPQGDALGNAKSNAGESYVIYGAAVLPATIDLTTLGSAGITIFGADPADQSGFSVSSAGDVNGDGFDDLIIGAYLGDAVGNAKSNAGESYLIFGGASLPFMIDLATLGSAGITIFGADSADDSGFSVSSAGDVNGDGFDDLAIGARGADASGNAKGNAGESYLIFGAASLPATINLANLGSLAGIIILGADTGDQSGTSVSSAGDINGDGFDDLVIGAKEAFASGNARNRAGESYVIFGAASLPTTIDLAILGSAGITIFGADAFDRSGTSVSSAGDINGDGFDDLIIGAYGGDALGNARSYAGDSYVIFGGSSLPPTIDLANLGSAGITIFGAEIADTSGRYVSGAGDINGDGFDDLIVGAPLGDGPGNNRTGAGESYVIFGAESLPATIDLATLGTAGIRILGTDTIDQSGRSASRAGDINGDGFDDLIIGAFGGDASGNAKSYAGESYVIFSRNEFTNSILPANLGNSSANTLNGASGAQILNGADGNDTVVGNGGADILIGGRGNDVLAVSDLTFKRIVGGTGTDTVRVDGSGHHLNLPAIGDNRIVDIETIDITGSGNNTLTLNYREVLNISSHSNTLVVRRNAGDVVNIGPGWTQQANELIGPDTFEVFTQGAAMLKIQLAFAASTIVGSFVNHLGYSGSGSSIDTGKVLAKEGPVAQLLDYNNLINTSRGINGVVFDIDNLPGTPTAADFVFQMSPTGAFDLGANPAGSWTSAPLPSSVSVSPGSPSRVSLGWADNALANRWLRITALANANTGLLEPEVYYVGHLLGETTGPSGSVFTVSFADVTPIRTAVGSTVNASNTVDIDKNGTVAFADISAMRGNVGAQLTIITIPAAGGGGGMASTLTGNGNSEARSDKGLIVVAAPAFGSLLTDAQESNHLLDKSGLATAGSGRSNDQLHSSSSSQWLDQGGKSLATFRAREKVFAYIGAGDKYKPSTDNHPELSQQALGLEWESLLEQLVK